MHVDDAMYSIKQERDRAVAQFKRFNSAHEGFAVIKEEYDELWDEIKKKQSIRSNRKMRNEAVQLGAMVIRFLTDVID